MGNSNFSFRKDFGKIMWKETLWINFLRSLFAGPVIMILMLMTGESPSQALSALIFPITYFVAVLPLGLFMAFLSDLGVPVVWIFPVIFSVMVAIGDPFVFILRKFNPSLVPVYKFNFMNFVLILFVLETDPKKYVN